MLATRRREGEYDELPHQQQHGGVGTCGKAMEKRKMEMLRSFAKVFAIDVSCNVIAFKFICSSRLLSILKRVTELV